MTQHTHAHDTIFTEEPSLGKNPFSYVSFQYYPGYSYTNWQVEESHRLNLPYVVAGTLLRGVNWNLVFSSWTYLYYVYGLQTLNLWVEISQRSPDIMRIINSESIWIESCPIFISSKYVFIVKS